METKQIRLLPLDPPAPRPGHMPLRQACRWRSEFELLDPGQPMVEVFLTQKAYTRANAQAHSDLDNEVGGWLVGSRRLDLNTGADYIVVERCLPALHARHGSAFLTFTQDSQLALVEIMEEKFPDKELVGWYHTHPRMSVFLSNYDTFLHNHFFPHPWQVALVIEPHTEQAGFFIRDKEGYLDPRAYYGFHELTGGQYQSIVRWSNLTADLSGSPALSENEHE